MVEELAGGANHGKAAMGMVGIRFDIARGEAAVLVKGVGPLEFVGEGEIIALHDERTSGGAITRGATAGGENRNEDKQSESNDHPGGQERERPPRI